MPKIVNDPPWFSYYPLFLASVSRNFNGLILIPSLFMRARREGRFSAAKFCGLWFAVIGPVYSE
jgi:hypothetical protein